MPVTLNALVMAGAVGVTVKVTFLMPVPSGLVALTVAVKVAEMVGVPEMRPVAAVRLSPGGSTLVL